MSIRDDPLLDASEDLPTATEKARRSSLNRSSVHVHVADIQPNFKGFLLFWFKSLQASICFIIEYLIGFLSLTFLSHESDTTTVGALGLASSWMGCLGYSFTYSINSGLETLASQAFGSRDFNLMISYLHKTIILQIGFIIPLSIVSFFAADVMIALGLDPETSRIAGSYIRLNLPTLLLLSIYDCIKAYLHAQGVFDLQVYAACYVTVLHAIFCYLFINWLQLGIKGAALANLCTYGILAVVILGLTIKHGTWKKKWRWFNKDSFKNWRPFLKSSLTTGMIMYLAWIGFELYTLQAGRLKNAADLAAQTILVSAWDMIGSFAYGTTVTSGAFVGNAAGEGNVPKAKIFALMGVLVISCELLIVISMMWLLRYPFYGLYTSDETVIKSLENVFSVFSFGFIPNWLRLVVGSVLSAVNKPHIVTVTYLLCYYAMGQPLCYYVTQVLDYGLFGVWSSFQGGVAAQTLILIITLIAISWDKQVDEVKVRLKIDKGSSAAIKDSIV